MILPNDILIRDTSNGQTVWVSQRLVVEMCGIKEENLRKTARVRYKRSLPPSWLKITGQEEFFLGATGESWRWGRKGGQYYYDIDTIPDRKPVCYRSMLPTKGELIRQVDENRLRGSRERQAEQRRMILEQVDRLIDNADITYYAEYMIGDKRIFNQGKAAQMAEAVAWCRFLKGAIESNQYKQLGFASQNEFLDTCAEIISTFDIEGFRIKTPGSLRKKVAMSPDRYDELRRYLVSGKYGNDNRRIIGKCEIVDYSTGEVLKIDMHEAVIMTYWLNPGGATKGTKRELWQLYASDMEAARCVPVKPSTFNHYTNTWANKVMTAKERHGTGHFRSSYKPYTPSKPLEYANSLWASDGSGVVPYRYRDQYGQWRSMKLYVMMVSDVASRYIAGYAVSRRSQHIEDFSMLRSAMQMALLDNGKTEVLDFISDNHGAYTSAESKAYLRQVCRNFRTIEPGNSQANPAEMMFRLFKRRFKSYFNLPETSWNAKSLESMANPDYFDIMTLPTYDEAIVKLQTAIETWNNTELSNGITPAAWFHGFKNERAGQYSDRQWRVITGEVSKKDLSYARSIMELQRGTDKYKYDIPSDAATVALIARYMGYDSAFKATVYWDRDGADVYSPDGVYMFSCPPAMLSAKSESEASHDSHTALAYYQKKSDAFEQMADRYVRDIEEARQTMFRGYEFNVQDKNTKEDYNLMMEHVDENQYRRALNIRQAEEEKKAARRQKKADKVLEEASLSFKRDKISDMSKYIK